MNLDTWRAYCNISEYKAYFTAIDTEASIREDTVKILQICIIPLFLYCIPWTPNPKPFHTNKVSTSKKSQRDPESISHLTISCEVVNVRRHLPNWTSSIRAPSLSPQWAIYNIHSLIVTWPRTVKHVGKSGSGRKLGHVMVPVSSSSSLPTEVRKASRPTKWSSHLDHEFVDPERTIHVEIIQGAPDCPKVLLWIKGPLSTIC
jgi:hypothetical protein